MGEQGLGAAAVELGQHVVEQQDRALAAGLGDGPVDSQAQGQGEGALLALAGVGASRQVVDAEHDLVPVGPDRGDATTQVLVPGISEGRGEPGRPPGGVVGGRHGQGDAGEVPVRLGHAGHELGQGGGPPLGQGLPGPGEAVVPHVEGERGGLVEAAAALLEQGVALLEDALDVAAHPFRLVVEPDRGLVQPPAPLPGATLDQDEVVRAEQRDRERVEQVPPALDRLAVQLHPAPAACGDLGLDQQLAGTAHRFGPHDGPLGTGAHHGVGGGTTQRGAGQVGHGLEQVGLALPVAADDGRGAARERDVSRLVAAVVGEPEVAEVECQGPTAPGRASAGTGSRPRRACGPRRA